jgi:hypothetical protein
MKNKTAAQAVYHRGLLTLDLPDAREPILWRQEIKDLSHVIFTLQTADNGEKSLVLRQRDGGEQVIAVFNNPKAADAAMAVLRPVLMPRQKKNIFLRVLKWLLILLAIYLCVRLAIFITQNVIANQIVQQVMTEQDQSGLNIAPQGVPLLADDYLQAPVE